MATVDALRAEYAGEDVTEAELATEANDRAGMLLIKDGWARANLGQVDEALADFARADALVPRYYFDIPEYDLNVYWARTLVIKGDFVAAIEKSARSGLVMGNEAAMYALKGAYVGLHTTGAGFEMFAELLHHRIATRIEDFAMPNYDGARQQFADLRGDVTVLTLWFPT